MNDILAEIDKMFDDAIEANEYKTLGKVLEEKRESLKLKKCDMANITGLSETLIGRVESDSINDLKISTVKKLSTAYNVPLKTFINNLVNEEELDLIRNNLKMALRNNK